MNVPINILNDSDNQFSMDITLHEVSANQDKGIQKATFTINSHQVEFANDGSLIVDGVNKGKLEDEGFIAPIDLGNGVTIRTAMMDDGGGNQVERFVLITPEYEITAAQRKRTDAKSYFDINIAERTANASDNASGDKVSATGETTISDLLSREP